MQSNEVSDCPMILLIKTLSFINIYNMFVHVSGKCLLFMLTIPCRSCQSFVNICHSYGTLRVVRYWMVHSHSNNGGVDVACTEEIKGDVFSSFALGNELTEPYNGMHF